MFSEVSEKQKGAEGTSENPKVSTRARGGHKQETLRSPFTCFHVLYPLGCRPRAGLFAAAADAPLLDQRFWTLRWPAGFTFHSRFTPFPFFAYEPHPVQDASAIHGLVHYKHVASVFLRILTCINYQWPSLFV